MKMTMAMGIALLLFLRVTRAQRSIRPVTA